MWSQVQIPVPPKKKKKKKIKIGLNKILEKAPTISLL
jgi:hypothetical protein